MKPGPVKRILRQYFFRDFPKAFQRASINVALRKIMPEAAYQVLLQQNRDPRQLCSQAAHLLAISEDRLLQELSWTTLIPLLTQVPPVDLERLAGFFSAPQLRATGSIPLVDRNGVSGLICCDPTLSMELAVAADLPRYLAAWRKIQAALSISEDNYRANQAAVERDLREQVRLQTYEAFSLALLEAARYGQDYIDINWHSGRLIYSFINTGGQRVGGTLTPELRDSILALAHNGSHEAPRPKDSGSLRIRTDAPGALLRITYQPEAPVQPVAAKIATSSSSEAAAEISRTIPEVPPEPPPPPAAATEPDFRPAATPPGSWVLLIDDSKTFAQVLTRFLERQGIPLLAFADPVTALEQLSQSQQPPALIVLDLHMPAISGLDLLARFRALPAWRDLPIMMLSSDDGLESEIVALERGADLYLPKSCDPRLLSAYIKRLLNRTDRPPLPIRTAPAENEEKQEKVA